MLQRQGYCLTPLSCTLPSLAVPPPCQVPRLKAEAIQRVLQALADSYATGARFEGGAGAGPLATLWRSRCCACALRPCGLAGQPLPVLPACPPPPTNLRPPHPHACSARRTAGPGQRLPGAASGRGGAAHTRAGPHAAGRGVMVWCSRLRLSWQPQCNWAGCMMLSTGRQCLSWPGELVSKQSVSRCLPPSGAAAPARHRQLFCGGRGAAAATGRCSDEWHLLGHLDVNLYQIDQIGALPTRGWHSSMP